MFVNKIVCGALVALSVAASPMSSRGGGTTCGANGCVLKGITVADCTTIDILSLQTGETFGYCPSCDGSPSDGTCKVVGLGVLDCDNVNVKANLGGLLSGLGLKRAGCTVAGISIGDCDSINIIDVLGRGGPGGSGTPCPTTTTPTPTVHCTPTSHVTSSVVTSLQTITHTSTVLVTKTSSVCTTTTP